MINLLNFFYLFSCTLMDNNNSNKRKDLNRNVLPSHYDLSVNVEPDSFSGSVTMHLSSKEMIDSFKFNSKDLELSNLEIKQGDLKITPKFEEKDEFITISLERKIEGEFKLFVEFRGKYSNSMAGFYKSKYNENNLFSTHFEPADARMAFPCFDQPDMKATFSIGIKVPEGYIALSNEEVSSKSGTQFHFKKTPIMSTYIVAYVVGKLGFVEEKCGKIPIRVYADEVEKDQGKFALDVAVRCLKFYEKYFGIDYPLSKLDMVAIPSFAMGAMENWGLVTYRKTSLLFDEKSTPIVNKKNIANTVCHELAHMWFGNLVTMKWWNDLWLNEGFATWAAVLAIENSLKDILQWEVWTSFITDEIETGMNKDCKESTHKIGVEVNDPVEVDQIFDAISYDKGSSVIKMVENWLGAEVFREGLVHYFKTFKYSNTSTKDLWDSLSLSANKHNSGQDPINSSNSSMGAVDVESVIDPWIKRDGFPYLIVEDKDNKIKLTQKRFTVGYKKDDKPWPIPLRILWIDSNSKTEKVYLMKEETLEICKEAPIYKINNSVSGFYRVLYPQEAFKRLFDYNLSTENKLNLFSDTFALTKALILPLKNSIDLFEYLSGENNYEIFLSVFNYFSFLRSVFYDNSKMVNLFESKISGILNERFSKINLKKTSKDINTVSLESIIVSRAVSLSLPAAIKEIKNTENIDPEYIRPYLAAKIDDDFVGTFKLYKTSLRAAEKQSALLALGNTKVEENIDFIFENIKEIEPQDSIYIFVSLGSNIKMRNKVSNLFIKNFEKIKEHISNSNLIRHSIEYTLGSVFEEENKKEVLKFLEKIKEDREMKSAIDSCKDTLKIGEEFRKRYSNYDL